MNESFSCANCDSNSSFTKYHFQSVNKRIIQCSHCGLMVIHPFPNENDLQAVYDANYFTNKKLTQSDISGIYGYSDYISERLNKQGEYKHICDRINRYQISTSSKPELLDYGCGLGHFLDLAFDYGYSVQGVEFNKFAIDYIQSRYSYKIHDVADYASSGKKFDVITLFDVIEHLPNPFSTLDELSAQLNDNGLIVITTTDAHSWISLMMGKRLEDFRRTSEHIFFFSKKNLSELLIKKGYDILEMTSVGHSFELQLLANRLANVLPPIGYTLNLFLKIFPSLQHASVYVNPLTKMIVYARKKPTTVGTSLSDKTLSIIIPVHNEQLYIKTILTKIIGIDLKIKKEIIVVDDGSTDNTARILQEFKEHPGIKIIHKPNGGKGSAVSTGVKMSSGDYVLIQDADLEYDPCDIPILMDTIKRTGANAVYGSRYSGKFRKTGYFLNTIANNLLSLLTNIITGLNLSDMETGYKLFNGDLIRSIPINSKGFDFEPEITCKISRMHIPIFEAPISYNARSYYEGKKVRYRDGVKAIFALTKYGILGID